MDSPSLFLQPTHHPMQGRHPILLLAGNIPTFLSKKHGMKIFLGGH